MVAKSRLALYEPKGCSLSMGFPRQGHLSGLPFNPPGDLPNPGIELTSPALAVDSLPLSHWENQMGVWGKAC